MSAKPAPSNVITISEWLSELERIQEQNPGEGQTVAEIAEASGYTNVKVQRLLREALKAGRLHCGRRPEMAIDGRRLAIPVYTILPAK